MIVNYIDIGYFAAIVGALTLVTNVITEVIKKTTSNKIPIQITATIVAMAITLVAFFAYSAISGAAVVWYGVAGAIVTGFFVSYAAQFGFDKLKEVLNKYR